ncbi:unnamed protein product [Anisakis simplex]|uniref:G_PROTEIN_RECEP_F1_2 domain-containing protein n=1 Tax=Anisakis simplex TaxID=6269 RepID=A0A0M3JQT1_ANISI|nr:unnamed protein product [Anisakis simplex]
MCGNASILTIIRGVISERRRLKKTSLCAASRARLRRHAGEQTILYIAALCVVDLLMSLSLPPAILVCVCAVAFLLLLPMLTYARANEVILHQLRQTDPLHKRENITRVRIYKCSDMMPPYVFYWFTCSTFLLGYVVPLLLIVYFNLKLIRKLYRHAKIQPRSGIPLRRVVTYTLLIAVFYFLCWTPYWCSVLYAIYMSIFSDGRTKTNELLLFIIYCVHLLPYFGSASNWILYGLLNTQLQQKHDSPTAIHRSPNAIPCSHSPLRSL